MKLCIVVNCCGATLQPFVAAIAKTGGYFPRNPLVFNYLGKPPKTVVGMVCFELFGGEFPEVGRSLFGSEQSSQAV